MNFPPNQPPVAPRERRGSSLVITLAFLVILTILVIGINETTRMDRNSSNLYVERTHAAMYSQNGIENVIAKLQQATADVNRHWLSQPGQIVVGAEEDDGNTSNGDSRKILTGAKTPEENPGTTDARIVYLHSGSTSQTSFPGQEFLNPPNLNVATFQDPSTLLITNRLDSTTGTEPKMIVRWNYVRKDGTIDTSESPVLTSTTNPIVGRYAYWADDESSKINYNLAWKRDYSTSTVSGTLPMGHPSRVNLCALDDFSSDSSLADKLHAFLTTDNYATIANHLFNSPADARQVSDAVATALTDNKFEVTHYNHDPDTTFFNEERIVLTTGSSRASSRPYLDILKTQGSDPGYTSNLDEDKLNIVLFGTNGTASSPVSPGLVYYLSRTDWPMITGTSSFQSKYFSGNKSQLVQFAINIIDYVRSAESSLNVVEPIRGQLNSSGKFVGEWVDNSIRGKDNTFKGLTRAPLITKMGLTISTNSTPQMKFFIEVYLPANYGIDQVDLVNDFRYIFQVNNEAGTTRLAEADQNNAVSIITGNIKGGSATLTKGNYACISKTLYFNTVASGTNKGATLRPDPGDKVGLRAAIAESATSTNPSALLEVVPIGDPIQASGTAQPAGALCTAPSYTAIGSYAAFGTLPTKALVTDDPRVSGIAKDWSETDSPNWGSANTVNSPLDILPEQDTDSSGNISQASLYMPSPKGSTANPEGLVSSNGELGYIHTGMQVTSSGSAGIPWRTIRLQPSQEPATVVPDWAFMDLFTAPITVGSAAKPIFAPHDTATGGRVNINAWAEPSDGTTPFGGHRLLPLEAVFLGARCSATSTSATFSSGSAAYVANNIYNRTTATNGKLYGYTNGYFSQGEVVEIKGVADQGEASEETVRQIANQITARGDVFSIYTIGQSLRQTPQGKLVVTAENRQQAMVERYLDSSTDTVRFRTIYCRPLTP